MQLYRVKFEDVYGANEKLLEANSLLEAAQYMDTLGYEPYEIKEVANYENRA